MAHSQRSHPRFKPALPPRASREEKQPWEPTSVTKNPSLCERGQERSQLGREDQSPKKGWTFLEDHWAFVGTL